MVKLDPRHLALLLGKNFVFISTLNKDGSPQLTPTWVDTDGENVLVNTAIGRKKQRNVTRDPRVSLSMYEQSNPYNHFSVDGIVVKQVKGKKAEEHIDKMAMKYEGLERYANHSK